MRTPSASTLWTDVTGTTDSDVPAPVAAFCCSDPSLALWTVCSDRIPLITSPLLKLVDLLACGLVVDRHCANTTTADRRREAEWFSPGRSQLHDRGAAAHGIDIS